MDRKTVVAFACGTALASGVAYVAVNPRRAPDPARPVLALSPARPAVSKNAPPAATPQSAPEAGIGRPAAAAPARVLPAKALPARVFPARALPANVLSAKARPAATQSPKPKLRKPSPMPVHDVPIHEEIADNLPPPEPAGSSPAVPESPAPQTAAPQAAAPQPITPGLAAPQTPAASPTPAAPLTSEPPPRAPEPAAPQANTGTTPPVPNPAPAIPAAPPAPRPEVRQPLSVTLIPGMILTVRVGETISTGRNQPGDTFLVTLDQPLVVDGYVIAERGARAQGRVVETRRAEGFKGRSVLGVELAKFATSDGQTIPIQTVTVLQEAENPAARNAAKVGIGAVIGAAIGGIADGGRGAGIGAGVGGAAGAGDVLFTRGRDAIIPVETKLIFRIERPITITERLR